MKTVFTPVLFFVLIFCPLICTAFQEQPVGIVAEKAEFEVASEDTAFPPALFSVTALDTLAQKTIKKIDVPATPHDFPMSHNYQFLIHYYALTQQPNVFEVVKKDLGKFVRSGVYDHIGGGFVKYNVSGNIFQYEKTLAQNALMVSLYSEAYRVTKDSTHKATVYQTIDFILKNLTDQDGSFFTGWSISSEREEGQFYGWTKAELDLWLGEEASIFNAFYNVTEEGNWAKGRNILYQTEAKEVFARRYNLSLENLDRLLGNCRLRLLSARLQRPAPSLDTKKLTSANALMIRALIDAYRTFGEERFLETAIHCAKLFYKKVIAKDNSLLRVYQKNMEVPAFLDDYAFLIDAFLQLYQVTFDEKWLYKANGLSEYVMQNFLDVETPFFFYSSDWQESVFARKKEIEDKMMPSSNSIMAKNLHYLGLYFFNPEFVEHAQKMVETILPTFQNTNYPNFYTNWGNALTDFTHEPFEVAIVGDGYDRIRRGFDEYLIPNMILLGGKSEGTLDLLEGKLTKGETTIYVCRNKICKIPVYEVSEALSLMQEMENEDESESEGEGGE